jgi:hypothetical protein
MNEAKSLLVRLVASSANGAAAELVGNEDAHAHGNEYVHEYESRPRRDSSLGRDLPRFPVNSKTGPSLVLECRRKPLSENGVRSRNPRRRYQLRSRRTLVCCTVWLD